MQRFLARTVINPTKPLAEYITSGRFKTESMLVAATPQHAEPLMDLVGNSTVQCVGMAVDSVPYGNQRNGVSILQFDQRMKLDDQVRLQTDSGHEKSKVRGLVNARKNWALSSSFAAFEFGNSRILLPVANTTFNTGTQSTLAFNDPEELPLNKTLLSAISVKLPSLSQSNVKSTAPLIPLTDDLVVTSFKDNMIKTLNDSPAAGFLENAEKLQTGDELVQRSRKVFGTIKSPNGEVKRFEVTAGGGGSWSPRASMLVLEPEARFEQGDTIQFSMYEPTDENKSQLRRALADFDHTNQLIMESTPKVESTQEETFIELPQDHIIDSFGFGSESGFLLNDTKHAVDGEVVSITVT